MLMNEGRENLTSAELRAKISFESGNNFAAVIADLRFRQRRFAALESHADEQRIFSGGNILPAEKIRGFDRMNFADSLRLNCLHHVGKLSSVGEQQREIALDARESRQRLVPTRFFRRIHRTINRIELQFRDKYLLPQF